MRLAFVGNFLNYGSSLITINTAIVYLLAELEETDCIDVYCHLPNDRMEEDYVPDKVNIFPIYDSKRPLSTLNLYVVNWKKYDSVVFNLLPTTFGRSSIANLIGLTAPTVLSKLGNKNIKIIYHNSTITNDFRKLGYNSSKDKIRSLVLSWVEKLMFQTVPTFFPVSIYVDLVRHKIKGAKVNYINLRYFEGLTTIFINRKNGVESIETSSKPCNEKVLLLHGYWGPQKNLELALSSLKKIRDEGIAFHLILSGKVNSNFQSYNDEFKDVVEKYSSIINERIEYVTEKDIMWLFLKTDMVIIPYNTPGGHSGVMETAITFNKDVLCISHPEYEEQAKGIANICLTSPEDFFVKLKSYILSAELRSEDRDLMLALRIRFAKKSMLNFIRGM